MVIIQIQGHIEFDLHTAIDDCQYICQQQKNNSTYKRIYYYLPANHLGTNTIFLLLLFFLHLFPFCFLFH